ncbi:MAG: hypothetical protein H6813_01485 [Phycisphaeraceae bacterium]|nr:hypothetical protein [Phycisphaeraceae bacterium]
MKNRMIIIAAAATTAALAAGAASASIVFHDDFESGSLANWTGKSFGAHDAHVENDPTNGANKAITFETLESAGEIFSVTEFSFADASSYEVSFDYLGFAKERSVAGDFGGYVGVSQGTPGTHQWMYGTSNVSGAAPDLVDDGVWRTYTFAVDADTAFGGGASGFHLMFEDFSGAGGVAGDVFFDNITVRAVPSPGAGVLAATGFLSISRRRKRAA